MVLDESGAVINQTDYEPFGATVAVTGIDTRKKFIDKERDGETGTANHGVRQYDPEIGGFGAIDPLWEKYRSLTPYHYAANNPVSLSDPDGRKTVSIHGVDAEQVTRELDEATSLALTRDPNTGQISGSTYSTPNNGMRSVAEQLGKLFCTR